eukprot:TRINITY_DN14417_c0_g2_i1.p1 TRINITY_DN14417_c0_g2~~TRINITY_DN14417_c0_g2_i1.p1  ORF type:complete len:422 (-),score=64.07 TRINITY_DN14417_c0_g2_i1:251-1516(-)
MAAGSSASAFAITLNVITCGIGAGVLTMPWGMAGASIITFSLLVVFINAINFWTLLILIEASERLQVFDLGALLRKLPGAWGSLASKVSTATVWSTRILTLLGYTIIAVDSITAVAPFGSAFSQRWVAAIATGIVVFPVCLLDQRRLAFTSSLSIGVILYVMLLVACAAYSSLTAGSVQYARDDICIFGVAGGAFTAACLIYFGIIMQMCVQPMYKDLADRSPEKMRRILVVAFTILTVLYIAIGLCGYLAFGPNVSSDAISALPPGFPATVARGAMALCIVGVFPIQLMPVLAPFKREATSTREQGLLHADAESGRCHTSGKLNATVVYVAAGVVLFVTLASFRVSSLGPLVAVNGAVQVSTFAGLMPGAAGLFLLDRKSARLRICCILLIIGSFFCSIGGFVFTNNHPDSLARNCAAHW